MWGKAFLNIAQNPETVKDKTDGLEQKTVKYIYIYVNKLT